MPTALLICIPMMPGAAAFAAGTPVGTVIENTAVLNFDLGGVPTTIVSNTTTLTVAERLDVAVALQSAQVPVAANDVDRALLFTVANTGNGSEGYSLAVDNALGGDDFDPIAAVPAIYFDTDASGDLTPGDQPYTPGSNDPVLAADATVDVLIVNDIPSGVVNGNLGRSQLTATALTGSGAPGTVIAGQGDGGVDAVVGSSGAAGSEAGEYFVAGVQVSVVKSQSVSDPSGGSDAVPGATISYTITFEVIGNGTANASVLRDPIPTFASYAADTLLLNGAPLTDAVDADAGELDTNGAATVVVRLGNVTLADGPQTVEFQVTVD